ncbi:hypothetical protein ACFXGA_38415 [Actinosynnema sp. NPDC059335]|uniref:hypothetical protein n=1 Tax=Actinosynnema sp. NPDC059335 TaxID=3346804 RepID=UPI00366C2B32
MFRRPLLPTVLLALVTGVALLVLVSWPGRRVEGTPVPHCSAVELLFGTDEAMRGAAEGLRRDPRVREVRDERTRAENYARLTAALRAAGHDDLADAARVERTPASLRVVEAFGVDPRELAGELRQRHRVNVVDVCADPDSLPGGGGGGVGDDDGAAGAGDDEGRVEHVGGGGAAVGGAAAHDARLELQVAGAGADADEGGGGLDDVAGPDRGEERDVAVAGEQALVAVGADEQFGGDVAEQAQAIGAVDQGPAVVGVGVGHVAAVGDGESLGEAHAFSFFVRTAWTR